MPALASIRRFAFCRRARRARGPLRGRRQGPRHGPELAGALARPQQVRAVRPLRDHVRHRAGHRRHRLRGPRLSHQVVPGFSAGSTSPTACYCGQCARVCRPGAIVERSHVEGVVAALADPDTVVVAQVAPAVPATLLERRTKTQGVHTMLERLAAALKAVGFDAVFDTSFAADLTVIEEATELLERIREGGVLPMFTSCSPAWVRFVEAHRPDLIPHLSTCKSPSQMAGTLIKEIYPTYAGLGDRRLRRGLDHALHRQEGRSPGADRRRLRAHHARARRPLAALRRRPRALHLGRAARPAVRQRPAAPPACSRAAAASWRRPCAPPTSSPPAAELEGGPRVSEARGNEGVRQLHRRRGRHRAEPGRDQRSGQPAGDARRAARRRPARHFVEVMSCPSGCVGGGGQPYGATPTTSRNGSRASTTPTAAPRYAARTRTPRCRRSTTTCSGVRSASFRTDCCIASTSTAARRPTRSCS